MIASGLQHSVGVAWGLAAAVCLAAYFRLSADAGGGPDGPGPQALSCAAQQSAYIDCVYYGIGS